MRRFHEINILLDLDHTLILSAIIYKHTDNSEVLSSTESSDFDNNSFICPSEQNKRKNSNEILSSDFNNLNNQTSHILLENNKIYQVFARPGLTDFIAKLSTKFNLYIYTAGTRNYAEKIVNEVIDPHKRYIQKIFSRENCMPFKNNFLKKISFTGMKYENTILLDDNECVVSINAMNSVLVKKLEEVDETDSELPTLAEHLLKSWETIERKPRSKQENIANELTFNVLYAIHGNKLKNYMQRLKKVSDEVTSLFQNKSLSSKHRTSDLHIKKYA